MKIAFVTVGSTSFQALIDQVVQEDVLEELHHQQFDIVRLQYGKGRPPSLPDDLHGLLIECYDFKPSLDEDMQAADLVIGHAGAGTILEALSAEKQMIVVINDTLMHNHQAELATAMASRNHVISCTPKTLLQACQQVPNYVFAPYTPGDGSKICAITDTIMAAKAIQSIHSDESDDGALSLMTLLAATLFAFLAAYLCYHAQVQ
eukprot:TRINITY_DN5912_c0_g1_i1.p1 TRINITY_DN5912_c0_g1~~TRINITY_DN5912_c0_g1_i1.p1  ORF type:complete len:205 (+),score=33.16 TRINITY_DN5912_c0_g1_i1:67-681(+)